MTPATLSALVRSARAAGWGLSAGASPRHLPPDVRSTWTPAGPVSADGRRLPGVLRYQGGELGVTRSDGSYQRLARVPAWALPTVLHLVPSSTLTGPPPTPAPVNMPLP